MAKTVAPERRAERDVRVPGHAATRPANVQAAPGMPLFLQGPTSEPARLQTKLLANTPGDRFEEEADAVAERAQHASGVGGGGRQSRAAATSVAGNAPTAGVPTPLQPSGDGSPLSSTVRERVEPVLGVDLGGVRVHAGAIAAKAAAALNASAFTHANHIFVGGGSSEEDIALLAHEAAHVVQQGAARPVGGTSRSAGRIGSRDGDQYVVQREVLQYPSLFAPQQAVGRAVYLTLLEAFAIGLTESEPATFEQRVLARLDSLGSWTDDTGHAELRSRATALLHVTVPDRLGTQVSVHGVLGGLATLERQAGAEPLLLTGRSFGTSLALRMLAEDAGLNLLPAIDPDAAAFAGLGIFAFGNTLYLLLEAIDDPESRYRLELEGTIVALTEAREAFQQDPGNREHIGEEIGILARRALLLNAAIEGLRVARDAQPAGALEQQVIAASARIAAIRAQAADERTTREALGDRASLLAPTAIDTTSFQFPPLSGQPLTIEPEVALPQTTDTATIGMLRSARGQVSSLESQTEEMRRQVVPDPPAYTLDEFSRVYRRWFAFFSQEAERSNEQLQMILSFFDREALFRTSALAARARTTEERQEIFERLRTPYELTGIPSGLSSFSGGAARIFMLETFAPMIEAQLGGAETDFAAEIQAARPRRVLTAEGSAEAPGLNLSAGFDVATAQGWQYLGAEGASQARREDTAQRFSDVARRPTTNALDLRRLLGPRADRLDNPDARLVGIHETTARDGWSYLIEVADPLQGVIAREQRVVPPEVARYLLAREQLRTMTAEPLVPRVPGERRGDSGVAIGDLPTRTRGLEQAEATSVAQQRGEPRRVPDVVRRETQALLDSRRAARGSPATATSQLIAALERYIDGYFQSRTGEYRFAGVLVIADVEHDVSRDIEGAFSPEHLLQVAAYAYAVSFGTAVLNTLGPIGQIVSSGISGYLAANNCSPIAALAGLATFLRRVSEVTTLRQARTWAYLTRPIVGDLSALIDEVVGRVATRAARATFERLASSRPSTTRELLNTMGEIARDPAAREAMRTAIEAELARLGRSGQHDTPEYRLLEAMQVEVAGAQRRGPPVDPAIRARIDEVLRPTRRVEEAARDVGIGPRRSADERRDLEEAIPRELRDRVRIVENPMLRGTTVHVVARANEVQIQVPMESGVRPGNITAHLDVARDQVRFTGPLGRVRAMIDRVQGLISGRGPQGSRSREAELEVEKLGRMLDDLNVRRQWLEERSSGLGAAHRAADAHQRAEIDRTIASIERQLVLHAQDLGSLQAGRGFIAAVDSRATVRDALVRSGRDLDEATAFVRDAERAGRLDDVAQLVSVGTFYRLVRAGVPPSRIVEILATPDGYARLVRADLDPGHADARALLGTAGASSLARERARAATADLASSAADRLAAEWGVDPATGTYIRGSRFGPANLTKNDIEAYASRRSPPPEDLPRIVFRRWRYVQRVGRRNARAFEAWAEAGFTANVNRETSSPFEAAAVAAREGFLNNEALASGGQRTHDYGEWVTGRGRFVRSGEEAERRPRGAEDYYEVTTRPDGIRPRSGGGFDVIEHKHLTGETLVLDDSIQLRAQREMARTEGRGEHEIILSSDRGFVGVPPNRVPAVRPSDTVGTQSQVFYFDGATNRITHVWSPSLNRWVPFTGGTP